MFETFLQLWLILKIKLPYPTKLAGYIYYILGPNPSSGLCVISIAQWFTIWFL